MAEKGDRSPAVLITCEATAKSRKLMLPNKTGNVSPLRLNNISLG